MFFVADPLGLGLASSLAHPGGNLTGVATLAGGNFAGKAFDIIRELLPQAKRLAAFMNPSNEVHRLGSRDALSAAATLGFQLDVIEVRKAEEVPGAIATARSGGAEALYVGVTRSLTPQRAGCPNLRCKQGCRRSFWRAPERVAD